MPTTWGTRRYVGSGMPPIAKETAGEGRQQEKGDEGRRRETKADEGSGTPIVTQCCRPTHRDTRANTVRRSARTMKPTRWASSNTETTSFPLSAPMRMPMRSCVCTSAHDPIAIARN